MKMKATALIAILFAIVWCSIAASASLAADSSAATIPPGTTITMANWSQYRDFMPETMQGLFEGKYFWKLPQDVQMPVGPTIIRPLPKNYLEATEKYASQVKIVELPDGGLTLTNYHGGMPFPNAAEPHKGWKLLLNLWYRYIPHLVVDTNGSGCAITSGGAYNCQMYVGVKRQLAYNTDSDAPPEAAGPDARYFTEWFMTTEPEQDKYTAYLTVNFADLSRPEEAYVFLPSLRRYQPISTAGRCAPTLGMDPNFEDFHNGFDTNLTQIKVDDLGHRKILALIDVNPPSAPFPGGVLMPLGFPTPQWGKWQVRDVDVLSVKKLPSHAAGYCYGNRVIYADSHFNYPLWEDLYDSDMKLWKIFGLFPLLVNVPNVGPVNTGALDIESYWDIQKHHASVASEPALGKPYYINSQAPKEYRDDARYTTPAGLNLIMR